MSARPCITLALLVSFSACADLPAAPPSAEGANEADSEGYALEVLDDAQEPEVTPDADEPALEFSAEEGAKYVFGADGRRVVSDTSVAPYLSTVLVTARFKSHLVTTCTGTLIAADAVLTAAHCVHDVVSGGGQAVSTTVAPGAYVTKLGAQRALPSVGTTYGARLFYESTFRDHKEYDQAAELHDYAVIRLAEPLGKITGVRSFGTLARPAGRALRSIAYRPYVCSGHVAGCQDDVALEMYEVRGSVGALRAGDVVFDSYLDGEAGSSGAGITSDGLDADRLFAIDISENHDGDRDKVGKPLYNSSLLLSPQIVGNIEAWLKAKVQ